MDAVQKANSGHPGAPMGMADIAEVLWRKYLRHNPSDPKWPNRDRFVLSNGHGSMLIYSLLHLSGYELSIDDIKDFRQLHSKTPGHPEVDETPGVETTTGPLGQGLANAVGMAMAEKIFGQQFNQEGHEIVDHYTYVFAGDGCLMEGVSHEACSLAGTLNLGKLILFYDNNGISIDGEVDGWFTEDIPKRFESYGWQVVRDVDGHDAAAIEQAIEQARSNTQQPTLIDCKTIIGWGSPNKQCDEGCHCAPLGDEEIQLAREVMDWPHAPFEIPESVAKAWDARTAGAVQQQDWQKQFDAYETAHPELSAEFTRRLQGLLPAELQTAMVSAIEATVAEEKTVATRKASELALNALGPVLPELLGGSADLTGSNNTWWQGCKSITANDASGNYIHYGVREFGMSAIMNGIALYGGFIPYSGTFLTFSDYARNAVRMSALMNTHCLFVYSHDSVGLGEDGPTHQPVEHVASLRGIPNMTLWRPCDTVESLVAWKTAIEAKRPASLILSRQGVPYISRQQKQIDAIARGAYVLFESESELQVIIIATGTEVGIALEAAQQLAEKNIGVRLVSMPSAETFGMQSDDYREQVLPRAVRARLAVEAGTSDYWRKFVGIDGEVIGVDEFGASAPGPELMKYFGFTVENIVQRAENLI